MTKKTPEKVFKEYQIALFCGSQLLPKSFYTLSEEEQIKVAQWIKEAKKENRKGV